MTESGKPGSNHELAGMPRSDLSEQRVHPRQQARLLMRRVLPLLLVCLVLGAIAATLVTDMTSSELHPDLNPNDLDSRTFARLLRSDDVDESYDAGSQAGRYGTGVLGILVENTTDPRPHVRECAALGIQRLAEVAPESALSAVIPLLDDPAKDVRLQACRTLAAFGPRASAAVEPLIRLLRRCDGQSVTAVAPALAAIGPAARTAGPELLATIQKYANDKSFACYYATLALNAVAVHDDAHVPVLV